MSKKDHSFLASLFALNDAASVRDEYIKAPFGFPGGKSRSLKNLLSILPYRDVWVDAFAGSGAVTLARHESPLEVFNDKHSGIISFFKCVRDPEKCKRLIERLSMTVCSREDFIWSRETWACDWLDDVERAARWYYVMQHSFNSKGWSFGRVTSGRSQSHKLHNNLEVFWPICHRLKKVYVENCDWRIVLKDYNNDKNGDNVVWFLDPPYFLTTGIYDEELKPEEHFEIGERCMHLEGFVALCGYDTEKHPYNSFRWDRKESWEVELSMTGLAFSDTNHLAPFEGQIKRGKVKETVWVKDSRK